jgi:hypothetical protein
LFRLHSARERATVLAAAYDAGIRHFDVAPLYGLGQAEIELGQFLRGRRDTVTVTTKFGLDPAVGLSAVRVVQGVARRLIASIPPLKRYLQSRRRPLARSQSFENSTRSTRGVPFAGAILIRPIDVPDLGPLRSKGSWSESSVASPEIT